MSGPLGIPPPSIPKILNVPFVSNSPAADKSQLRPKKVQNAHVSDSYEIVKGTVEQAKTTDVLQAADGKQTNSAVLAKAKELGQRYDQAVSNLKDQSLTVESAALGTPIEARLIRPKSAKATAAALFGIKEAEVTDVHLALLAQENPALAASFLQDGGSATLPAGTQVAFGATRVGAFMQGLLIERTELLVDQVIAEAQASAGPNSLDAEQSLTATGLARALDLKSVLAALRAENSQRSRFNAALTELTRANGLAEVLAAKGQYDKIGAAYDKTRKVVAELFESADEGLRAQAEWLGHSVELAALSAVVEAGEVLLAQGKGEAAGAAFQGLISTLDRELATPNLPANREMVYRQLRIQAAMGLAQGKLSDPSLKLARENPKHETQVQAAIKSVQGQVEEVYHKAIWDLDALAALCRKAGGRAAEAAKGYEDQARTLRFDMLSACASVVSAAGRESEAFSAIEDYLAATLGISRAQYRQQYSSTVKSYVTPAGEEIGWLKAFSFWRDRTVETLSNAQLDDFAKRFASLPAAQKSQVVDALLRMAAIAPTIYGGSECHRCSALLAAIQKQQNDPILDVRLQLLAAEPYVYTNNWQGALQASKEALAAAKKITQPELKAQALELQRQAVVNQASYLETLARTSEKPERAQYAIALRELRTQCASLFDPDNQAKLMLMEAHALLCAGKAEKAEGTLALLKSSFMNRGISWVDQAVAKFEGDNRDKKATAFCQMLLDEMNSGTFAEGMVATVGGAAAGAALGAAIGAGIGALAGGPGAIPGAVIGAKLGALIGAGTGTAVLWGRNIYRGRERIAEAGRTGLNCLSAFDTSMAAAGLLLETLGSVVPILKAGKAVAPGAKVITQALKAGRSLTREEVAVLSTFFMKDLTEQLGKEAVSIANLSRLTPEKATRVIWEAVAHQFADTCVQYGGKTLMYGGLTLMTAPVLLQVSQQIYAVLTSNVSEAEKKTSIARILQDASEQLRQTGGVLLGSLLVGGAVQIASLNTAGLRSALRSGNEAGAELAGVSGAHVHMRGLDAEGTHTSYDLQSPGNQSLRLLLGDMKQGWDKSLPPKENLQHMVRIVDAQGGRAFQRILRDPASYERLRTVLDGILERYDVTPDELRAAFEFDEPDARYADLRQKVQRAYLEAMQREGAAGDGEVPVSLLMSLGLTSCFDEAWCLAEGLRLAGQTDVKVMRGEVTFVGREGSVKHAWVQVGDDSTGYVISNHEVLSVADFKKRCQIREPEEIVTTNGQKVSEIGPALGEGQVGDTPESGAYLAPFSRSTADVTRWEEGVPRLARETLARESDLKKLVGELAEKKEKLGKAEKNRTSDYAQLRDDVAVLESKANALASDIKKTIGRLDEYYKGSGWRTKPDAVKAHGVLERVRTQFPSCDPRKLSDGSSLERTLITNTIDGDGVVATIRVTKGDNGGASTSITYRLRVDLDADGKPRFSVLEPDRVPTDAVIRDLFRPFDDIERSISEAHSSAQQAAKEIAATKAIEGKTGVEAKAETIAAQIARATTKLNNAFDGAGAFSKAAKKLSPEYYAHVKSVIEARIAPPVLKDGWTLEKVVSQAEDLRGRSGIETSPFSHVYVKDPDGKVYRFRTKSLRFDESAGKWDIDRIVEVDANGKILREVDKLDLLSPPPVSGPSVPPSYGSRMFDTRITQLAGDGSFAP